MKPNTYLLCSAYVYCSKNDKVWGQPYTKIIAIEPVNNMNKRVLDIITNTLSSLAESDLSATINKLYITNIINLGTMTEVEWKYETNK